MQILIDNIDLDDYGITVLNYSGALSFAAEREDNYTWADKSGIDKNLANIRYNTKEFTLKCIVKADNEGAAYNLVQTLVDYMYTKGVFILSLRDTARGIRKCFLCERSGVLVGDINIRNINSLYVFKLGLRDVNPNALKFYNTIALNETTILYTKGQTATLFWGNGDRDTVNNSGNYTKDDYSADGLVDIIADIDQNVETITPLLSEFSADVISGIKEQTVNFTDLSTGDVEIWSWDFGDGSTSSEQNPKHIYTEPGTYTVELQVFNTVAGYNTENKVDYISVRNAWMKRNDTEYILTNANDKIIKN